MGSKKGCGPPGTMATAALVLAAPPEELPPHAATTSTVAMANERAKALRVIRLPPCLSSTNLESKARVTERDRADAIGNRMLGQDPPLEPQVRLPDARVIPHLSRQSAQDDPPVLQDISPMGRVQRHQHVLLNQQQGRAFAAHLLDDVDQPVTIFGARPSDSSSTISSFGRA